MAILKTIFIVILIIIAVLIAIILLLLFIPFKYNLNIIYKNEERLELNLKFIIFRFTGYFAYTPEVDFEFKLWNKVLLKKSKDDDEEEEEENSIGDTDFIENKNLLDDVKESKQAIKDLFVSSKRLENKKQEEYEKELETEIIDSNQDENSLKEKDEQKKKAFNIIEKFKNLLDNDIIYVIKKVTSEGIDVLNIIKPKKYKIKIKRGTKDPYAMGISLAIAAPLYAFMGDDLKVVKNSESTNNWYSVNMIGYPQLYKLIPPIIRLYKDKKFMKIVSRKGSKKEKK